MIRFATAVSTIALVACTGTRPTPAVPATAGPATAALIVRVGDSAGVIRGVVRDSARRPIVDAFVTIAARRQMVRTDDSGRFRLAVSPGRVELLTRAIGWMRHADSLTIPQDRGLEVEIRLRRAENVLVELGPAHPPLLSLSIKRPSGRGFPYAIVTIRENGQPLQRDSIVSRNFEGDFIPYSAYDTGGNQGRPRMLTNLEVRAPGYKVWRRGSVVLPARFIIELEPDK